MAWIFSLKNWKYLPLYTTFLKIFKSLYLWVQEWKEEMQWKNAMCTFSYKENWEHLAKTYQITKKEDRTLFRNQSRLYFESNVVASSVLALGDLVFLLHSDLHMTSSYSLPFPIQTVSNCLQEEKIYHIQATGQPKSIWAKIVTAYGKMGS